MSEWPVSQPLGQKRARNLFVCAQHLWEKCTKRSYTGLNVTSTSRLFARSAGRCNVACYGAILNASNWLAQHFRMLPAMSQLIWWYQLRLKYIWRRWNVGIVDLYSFHTAPKNVTHELASGAFECRGRIHAGHCRVAERVDFRFLFSLYFLNSVVNF